MTTNSERAPVPLSLRSAELSLSIVVGLVIGWATAQLFPSELPTALIGLPVAVGIAVLVDLAVSWLRRRYLARGHR